MAVQQCLGWKRVRFDASCPRWWRPGGELVIGFPDSGRTVDINDHPREISDWLALADGSVAASDLLASGTAMGIAAAEITRVFTELARIGALYEVAVSPPALMAGGLQRDLHHTATLLGTGSDYVAEMRSNSRVLVEGIGGVAAEVFFALNRAMYQTGWAIKSTARIRAADTSTTALPPDLIGERWSTLRRPLKQPLLVVTIDTCHNFVELDERYPESLVLPVMINPHVLRIGPLLHSGDSLCAQCLLDNINAAAPDTGFGITQVQHQGLVPPLIADSWQRAAVGLLLAHISSIVDDGMSHGLMTNSIDLYPPAPQWRRRTWNARPDCRCVGFPTSQTA